MSAAIRYAVLALAGLAASTAYIAPAQAQSGEGTGEIKRVDVAAGKVTIQHGAISRLNLPAITLVYRADPKILAGIQPGDKVSFTAERQDGKYVVTTISRD
jgi:Cu/Ag efflux protein CusF